MTDQSKQVFKWQNKNTTNTNIESTDTTNGDRLIAPKRSLGVIRPPPLYLASSQPQPQRTSSGVNQGEGEVRREEDKVCLIYLSLLLLRNVLAP